MLAGFSEDKRAPAFDASSFDALLERLKQDFGLIVFDLPPTSELGKPFSFVGKLDGVLLVIEAEKNHHNEARNACDQLERLDANLLGTVLHKSR